MPKRIDYQIISGLIPNGSRVLDLGCGNGDLLYKLEKEHQIKGEGIEISDEGITECIKKGLAVHHGNLDEGLSDYADDTFDYVVLSDTLQATRKPAFIIDEMLRVGKKVIISFPNFGHYSMRFQLGLLGRMPVTKAFPKEWHDTPNIRHTTIKDFRKFCGEHGFTIEKEVFLKDFNTVRGGFGTNILSRMGIFLLSKEKGSPQ